MGGNDMQHVMVGAGEWHGDVGVELRFPKSWRLEWRAMSGHDAPALDDDAIRSRLNDPVGAPPLRELAAGRDRAAILFDDLDRPTPAARVVPLVLEALHEAGLSDEQIGFTAATAAHRMLSRDEMARKIGAEACARYPVYNHNAVNHLVDVGRTSFGTPLEANRGVMACDLKIGIGGLIPYHSTSHEFGGGAKIVLPGVSGLETIAHHHREVSKMGRAGDVSAERANAEEAAALVGLDMKIDLMVNGRREVADVVAGHVVAGYREGCRRGRRHYGTDMAEGADVVVVNTYPQGTLAPKALWCVAQSVREGGDLVVVTHRPEGMQQMHFLYGCFGGDRRAELRGARRQSRFPQLRQMTVWSRYLSRADMDNFVPAPQNVFHSCWNDVLDELLPHHGPGTRVAVYPCAPIQMANTAEGPE